MMAPLKGPCFWGYNVHTHGTPTYDEYTLKAEYEYNLASHSIAGEAHIFMIDRGGISETFFSYSRCRKSSNLSTSQGHITFSYCVCGKVKVRNGVTSSGICSCLISSSSKILFVNRQTGIYGHNDVSLCLLCKQKKHLLPDWNIRDWLDECLVSHFVSGEG
jgi:hypothetical protein